jgi:HAD superfamily hydrolase (TIGR01457 family)
VSLADRYDSILFDLDGVLYRGDQAVPGADDTIRDLRARGTGLAFVTNNSSRTPEQVAAKLAGLGIEVSPSEIVTSAVATAELLAQRGSGRAFVIGEGGIREALRHRGFELVDDAPEEADVVVIGWDRSVDYDKLKTASLLVQRGASLVATNADASYPAPDGLWPGAGAILAAVTTTTGIAAEVVGKPHAPLFQLARDRAGGGTAISVGDRLDTDIAGAQKLGWDSLLVFTGVTHPANLVRADELPTFVGRDASDLLRSAAFVRLAESDDDATIGDLLRAAGLRDGPPPDERIERWVATDAEDGAAVGTVALELAGTSAHVRSLAVTEDRRGARLGTLLTAHAVREARRSGATTVFIATESAEGFFSSVGFSRAGTLDALPNVFREHMSFCAQTAAVMRLDLHPTPAGDA